MEEYVLLSEEDEPGQEEHARLARDLTRKDEERKVRALCFKSIVDRCTRPVQCRDRTV